MKGVAQADLDTSANMENNYCKTKRVPLAAPGGERLKGNRRAVTGSALLVLLTLPRSGTTSSFCSWITSPSYPLCIPRQHMGDTNLCPWGARASLPRPVVLNQLRQESPLLTGKTLQARHSSILCHSRSLGLMLLCSTFSTLLQGLFS